LLAAPLPSLPGSIPLAGLLCRQLLAADLLQGRQIVARHAPQHVQRDALIFVPQHVPDACHLWPRNLWVPSFQLVGQVAACFRNDLNPAFDESALAPVSFEGLERHARGLAADVLDRVDDVCEAQGERRCSH